MQLTIIRHAHALDAKEDPERPLGPRGRKQVRRLGAFLRKSGALDVAEIWHSPLARSRETAQQLVERIGLDVRLVEHDGLLGETDPALIAEVLVHRSAPLAIVGHEPQLSALASLLVFGAKEPPRFLLKKCAALALERRDGHWLVRWQVSPEVLG
jgi:phosphohistidine phosphatase